MAYFLLNRNVFQHHTNDGLSKRKKIKMKKLLGLAIFLFAGAANAALVETDFLSSGDGLLFLDTNTNKEWVDVAKTTNMSVNQFFNSSIYAGQGFKLANQNDLSGLYGNAGATDIALNDSITFTAGNLPAAQLLADLMEHTSAFSQTAGNSWIHGYMDFGSLTNLTLSRFNAFGGGSASFGINTNGTYWSFDTQHSQIGVWAYRDVVPSQVPEPVSLALFGLGLAGIAFSRKKKSA